MKRLKECAWSLAIVAASGSYVFLYFRRDLGDPHTLALAGITGTVALIWFLYSVTSEAVHPLVTRIVVGCCALVATVCAGAFLRYTWTSRSQLRDSGTLPFAALICVLALGAALLSWKALWNCLRSKISNTDEPNFHP